jgi:preprotein translocase subunit YajC
MASKDLMLLVIQIGAILGVVYFLFMRPQAAARKKTDAMLAAIKKGDDVMTAGGIVGKVRDVRESLITIESGTAQIVVDRNRIIRVGNQTAAQGPGS